MGVADATASLVRTSPSLFALAVLTGATLVAPHLQSAGAVRRAARFLAALCEHEIAERSQRRIGRHLAESGLQPGKTLATFDFTAAPSVRKPHIEALATGATWIEAGSNILIFGPSGTGKTHVAAAIGAGLIDNGYRVLFTRTTDLVQKLQAARRDLILPATCVKLDKFDCLILDDLGYVRKDQAETTVLFELIAGRYERKSLIITCNQRFSEWDKVFPDPAVTVAAIDRLVHHSTIIEINTNSYRRRAAAENAAARKRAADAVVTPRTRAKAAT